MAQMPPVTELFADVDSAKKAAKAMESYKDALNKSFANPSNTPGVAPSNPEAALEALAVNKSLTPDAVAALNSALTAQRQATADIVKDITLTSPLSTSFAAYDLEAPAKLLTPRPTPLRNKIARKRGVGTAHRIKRITGYTGTGTGGVGNIFPGISETSTATFGSLNLERGPKISYAADDVVFPYYSFGLSDSVSFDANFSGVGYQDLRQLSSTSTLYASMLMEERMFLYSRATTANGGTGALSAPTVTGTARSATGSETAITGVSGGKIYLYATSDAGSFGESVSLSGVSVSVTTQVVDVTISAPITGALGYKIYASTGSTDPGRASAWYVGRVTTTGSVSLTIQGALPTSGNVPPASDTSAPVDGSGNGRGYDGIIPQIISNGGYVNNANAVFSTANPGVEFQTVFYNLYNNVKADPDEIFMNGSDRKQLSDAIKNGSTANYRLNLTQTDAGDYVGGATIGALYNEVTGKMVNITVHPWLVQGVAPVVSYTLPIPDTEVSDVWAAFNVQDYLGMQWPVIQNSYDFSTYWRGTMVGYAPAWNGIVTGIKNV